jgi:hypothetical protein
MLAGSAASPEALALEELLSVLLLPELPELPVVPEPAELLAACTWVTTPRGMEWCDILGP